MVALAVPVVLSELGWMAQGIVDIIMVGRLGPAAIGAVALGNAVYYTPALFGIGILLGLDTLVAQAYGRKDHDECHRWLAQGVWLACIATPPLMLLIALASYGFAPFGITPQVAVPAAAYLRILNWGTLPLLLYAGTRRYLQGVGDVRVITVTYVGANLINWFGNWVLIYGKWGMPALGVNGSAISTLVARIFMAVALLGFAWRYERKRGHPLFRHWAGPSLARLRELARLGVPAAGQIVLEVGAWNLATLSAGWLTPVALATHQIALNYASLTYMVPLWHLRGSSDQRRTRRGRGRPRAGAPRRLARPGAGHRVHAAGRGGLSHRAGTADRPLYARPAGDGRRAQPAGPGGGLPDLRRHSDRLHWSAARTGRDASSHAGQPGGLLGAGVAAGPHSVLCASLGHLRPVDRPYVGLDRHRHDAAAALAAGLGAPGANFLTSIKLPLPGMILFPSFTAQCSLQRALNINTMATS